MTRYKEFKNEIDRGIDSKLLSKIVKENLPKIIAGEVLTGVDNIFKGIKDLLQKRDGNDKIRALFNEKEAQNGLKYFLLLRITEKLKLKNSDVIVPEDHILNNLSQCIMRLGLDKEENSDISKIYDQFSETVEEQDPKIVSILEAIKLFFQEIIAKFKSKNLEDFNDKHTMKVDNATFYTGPLAQRESKQEVNEPDREIEEVLEQKVSKSPTLETIVKEDEGHNVEFDYVRDVQKGIYENVNFSIIPQFAQEETLSKPQVAQIREKPAIPLKSQKVIDAGDKIKGSQKTETPSYTSSCMINLKSVGEKPKIAPKPTVKVYTQAENQYGQNTKNMVLHFESLSSNTSLKPKVKNNVERLVEKFEAKNQEAATGRSR
ncbi:MAG: hypothetical protein sL5_04850 [Candidatus Mesenet longicola]|uniref:Uncharacterized protein n=1 Tax=Candidatus Mesenet longicola TaxID=1892558 RepID=A0A8J3MMT2_9RICK|nr:MAG: hypothetical protein sGL2_05220 [Candidatus Mesenet longicola]GHM59492.1 MAG: hypothetical protein sL5_04850 [Candidatus Mesenet longicola]